MTNLITPHALFSPIFLQSCYHDNGSDNAFQEIGLYSFEIFQDDMRLSLGFRSTRSRYTRSTNAENCISTKHVDGALLAIIKLSQLKAAILFPASRPYFLGRYRRLPFLMPSLHLPRALCDNFVCDFPYGFFGT